jgi:hypothetical protein
MVGLLTLANIALLDFLFQLLVGLRILLFLLYLRLVSLVENVQLLYKIGDTPNAYLFGVLGAFVLRFYGSLSLLNVLLDELV